MNIPCIYAYSDERFPNCLKVGYTTLTAQERVRQQTEAVKMPKQTWRIEFDELAIRNDGTFFTDHEIHRLLERDKQPTCHRAHPSLPLERQNALRQNLCRLSVSQNNGLEALARYHL